MLDNGFITCQDIDLENRYSIYYEALGINPLSLQKELENRTIVIDGCGGIGNMMSYTLCSMGIKKLILLDNDIVEESNLNRQFLFTKKDVGRRKVDVLREALIERSTDTEIVSIYKNVDYGYEKVEGHMDLVILSADGDMSMQVTNAYCVENRIPYINAGYLSDISIIGPFYIPDITACAMCHEDMYGVKNLGIFPEKAVYVNKKMKAPSMAANNFIASGMATVDIIYYFSGKYALINSLEKRMGINNRDFSRLSVDFRRNENCSICSDYKKSFSDTPFNKRVAV